MAPPTSITFFNFMISTYLILSQISVTFMKGHALERSLAAEINYHTVHVSSILPSSACKPSAKGPSRKSSLTVVHRHGPCHQLNQESSNRETLTQILSEDQTRVRSIQARHAFGADTDKIRGSKADLPAKRGSAIGTGNYVVSVGLGTPAKSYTLVFDTGSDLTWTQCEPCVRVCYKQQDPIYDPAKSSSYSNISCNAAQCSALSSATGNSPGCSASNCLYGIQYGDQSFSVGFFAKERLTLTPTDVFNEFFFGCGQNNQGLFGKTSGLLGLGRDPLSIVSQTAQKYGKYFSYCLPTKSGSNGHLTFGKGSVPNTVKFAPFSSSSSQSNAFYFLDIQSISVGGQLLSISASVFQTAGNIVDSGTVITRLPPAAYSALRSAFRQQMSQYKTAPAISILDTCYDFSSQSTVKIPKISIFFSGNVKVDLGIEGILLASSLSQVCLAFAGNSAATTVGIYGNIQQQTFEVVYDVAGGKLGFAPGGCS
ncbi:aspartyl protease family protein At5g10770 [Coffea arabica]|uniref:Aspartyl protease family protein At5g10770 n=1 Tax=Coffea arabica TaxID=13443 RepID=A0A6P6TYA7_COFAR